MGIAVNLVTYLGGTMHLSSASSANIVTDFMGTSFLLCLLGGFLADSFLGRYKTIAVFTIIQILVSLQNLNLCNSLKQTNNLVYFGCSGNRHADSNHKITRAKTTTLQ